MPLWTCVLNPWSDTCSLYGPGGRFDSRYDPFASVRSFLVYPVSICIAVTVGSLQDGAVLIRHPSTELRCRDLGEGGRAGEEQARGAETETSQGVLHNPPVRR